MCPRSFGLPRYYGAVRLPVAVHRRLAPVGFAARTATPSPSRPVTGSPSSCPESLRTCMGSTTARGPYAPRNSGAPVGSSAEGNGLHAPDSSFWQRIRGSIPSPHDPLPTLASRRYRRTATARVRLGALLPCCMALAPACRQAGPLLSVSYWRFSPDFLLLGGIGVSIGGVRCHKFERPAFGRHADGGAFAELLHHGRRPFAVNRRRVVLRELL